MTIWGNFDDHRILRKSVTFWGIEVAWIPFVDLWGLRGLWWPFEEFEDIVRISWEPEVWVPWVPFVHFLDLLRTLWTFWGLFEDQRTWCSQNIEEHFRDIWWLLLCLLRTWGLWGFQGLFRTLRIFANLITYWGIEVVDKLLRYLRSPWIPFVDLWGLRGLCGPFEEFEEDLRTWGPEGFSGPFDAFSGGAFWWNVFRNFWGLLWGPFDEHLRILWRLQHFEDVELFWGIEVWWLLVDLLRTWGLWGIQGLFRTLRTWSFRTWLPTEELRTLINFWGHWGRFQYLLTWPLRNSRTLRIFLSNLRIIWWPVAWERWPFVIFLTSRTLWTFWGLLEDLRTWGSQSIEEFSGPFDDLWWTFWGMFLGTFEDFVRTIWWTFEEPLTTTGFWGRW